MTLRELAEKRVQFYRRANWGPGEYAHAEDFLEDRETGAVKGYRACFCAAPIPGNHPECDDDLWFEYEGPETLAVHNGSVVSGALFKSDLPAELLEVLEALGKLAEIGKRAQGGPQHEVPDVPRYQIGKEMQA